MPKPRPNPTPDARARARARRTTSLTEVEPLPRFADPVLPALVPGGCVSRALLGDFVLAMQQQGLKVQAQRLRYDRMYARTCLDQAHSRGDTSLRALAVRLFDCIEGSRAG